VSIVAQKPEKSNSKISFFRGEFGFQYVQGAHTEELRFSDIIEL